MAPEQVAELVGFARIVSRTQIYRLRIDELAMTGEWLSAGRPGRGGPEESLSESVAPDEAVADDLSNPTKPSVNHS